MKTASDHALAEVYDLLLGVAQLALCSSDTEPPICGTKQNSPADNGATLQKGVVEIEAVVRGLRTLKGVTPTGVGMTTKHSRYQYDNQIIAR